MKRLFAIFSDYPAKLGLKGELQLWEEFKARFAHQKTPTSEEKFMEEMYAAFEELTGRPVLSETFIIISRTGTMASVRTWWTRGTGASWCCPRWRRATANMVTSADGKYAVP